MLKHVVFFKFKPDVTDEERQQAFAELRALPSKIDVIREFQVGEDMLRTARSWDAVLISTFDNREALEVYARHEEHVPVAKRIQMLCQAAGAVDFEC